MYSERITYRDIAALEAGHIAEHGRPFQLRCCGEPAKSLHPHTIDQVISAVDHLSSLFDPSTGDPVRPLTPAEHDYITNEMLLSSVDFPYWAERYAYVELDNVRGGIGRLRLWGSQRLLLNEIALLEEENWAMYDDQVERGYTEDMIRVPGICIILHKARQLGATTFAQCLLVHRAIFSMNLFCLIATVDDDKMVKLFEKTERLFEHLPRWMQPKVKSKTKTHGYKFDELDVEIARQEGSQKGGLGQGSTPSVVHLTEVSAWPDPTENLQNHLFKALPWSLRTLIILESTAQGEGNWWQHFFESVRKAPKSSRWRSVFVPWYAERGKYRLPAPPDWQPRRDTKEHARRVWETSIEFMRDDKGQPLRVMLDRDQMYWYEISKDEAVRDGVLNLFLLNYPSTPEESFRATNRSPFKAEVLDRLSLDVRDPISYLEWDYDHNKSVRADFSSLSAIEEPRGLIRIYHRPEANRRYSVGVDNARGIVGWRRDLRTDDDKKSDNGAIVILRMGERGEPDDVAATFFAPITPEDLAPIGNWMGRVYAGYEEDQAIQTIETWPSPGTTYQNLLITEYGYWNLYRNANLNTGNWSRDCGWEANGRTVQDLWVRAKRRISFCDRSGEGDTPPRPMRVQFRCSDPHIIKEMEHCEEDDKLMKGKAEYGYHDDLLRATMLAIWGGRHWTAHDYGDDREEQEAAKPKPDFQRSDLTQEEMAEVVNSRLEHDLFN